MNAPAMPRLPGLQVVRSSIDGYGVIAMRPFAEGELVAEVDGVAWHVDDAVDDRYSLKITNVLFFDMVDQTRWINHSCDPNCDVDVGVDAEGQPWARIVAARPIRAGEELCYDYAFPAELAEICRCGSPRCRGAIVDEAELVEGRRHLGLDT
jgi:SET domain-containing protein